GAGAGGGGGGGGVGPDRRGAARVLGLAVGPQSRSGGDWGPPRLPDRCPDRQLVTGRLAAREDGPRASWLSHSLFPRTRPRAVGLLLPSLPPGELPDQSGNLSVPAIPCRARHRRRLGPRHTGKLTEIRGLRCQLRPGIRRGTVRALGNVGHSIPGATKQCPKEGIR